ncbi:DUF465 domain-containing protein [Geopsychrobacter electrodiphilus]|uniref:DUF465 domain-containing protein n=1 Tax=Geopsychrobacter electrodiphilus TaxID=225196 RepID=UPI00035EECC7|nr:DUF465 domain-containing protein [Geopsychrobacter electrodiphilus]
MEIAQNILQQLLDTNPRFRLLYEEHSLFEKRLDEFKKKGFLSPQEELEVLNVKKMKLAGKDEMEQLVASTGC